MPKGKRPNSKKAQNEDSSDDERPKAKRPVSKKAKVSPAKAKALTSTPPKKGSVKKSTNEVSSKKQPVKKAVVTSPPSKTNKKVTRANKGAKSTVCYFPNFEQTEKKMI